MSWRAARARSPRFTWSIARPAGHVRITGESLRAPHPEEHRAAIVSKDAALARLRSMAMVRPSRASGRAGFACAPHEDGMSCVVPDAARLLTMRTSAPDRLLRLAEHLGRKGGKALEELLHLLG